jgi:hypothetical protein
VTARLERKDGRYLDFEDVVDGAIILVNAYHEHNKYDFQNKYPHVLFESGDIWVVESTANRPKVAIIRNLQRGTRSGIRVDALLELDDRDIVTIGPGVKPTPRDD